MKRKPERSENAQRFIETIDKNRKRDAQLMPGARSRERERVRPSNAPLSLMTELPRRLPIDYYAPSFHNSLSYAVKVQVADVGRLAFPADADQILANPRHPNEKLSAARLMHTFGDEILARYNLPGADGGDYDDDRVDSDDNEQNDEYGNDEDDNLTNTWKLTRLLRQIGRRS